MDLPTEAGAQWQNRLCASGLEAVGQAARAIDIGEAEPAFGTLRRWASIPRR